MNKKMTRTLLSVGVVAALATVGTLTLSSQARAARWRTCNGSAVQWRGTLHVVRNRCSIPDSGSVNASYWNGVGNWNDLSNVVDGFFVNAASDCSISHGDGQNEVGLVNRAVIDGNNGLTVSQLGLCFIGSNDIDEADVMIANDLPFDNKLGNFLGTAGRSTFVHEFGHLFGFLHEDAHDVLRTSPPHLLTGGGQASTVWPSDAAGMNALYGFASSRSNLLPSALGVVGGSAQQLDAASTVTVCRGGSSSARFYLGNMGNVSTGTYGLRIRLSTTAAPAGYTTGGTVVQSFTHSIGAFSEGTFTLPFTVPSSLANGIYNIYIDLDPGSGVSELREGDNRTISARRIRVNC